MNHKNTEIPDVVDIIIGSIIGGITAAIINIVFWYAFTRRENLRDTALRDLQNEVKMLSEERLATLDERLTSDHEAHAGLHDKINQLDKRFVTRQECVLQCRDGIEQIRKQSQIQSGRIEQIQADLSSTSAVVKLIADRLNVSLGGRAG